MIVDYTRPQLIIKQQLQKLPNGGQRVIGAFTLGPQFFLSRYTKVAERAKLSGLPFDEVTSTSEADWQIVPAENKLPSHVIDQDYNRLFAENIEGQLAVITSSDSSNDKPELVDATDTKPVQAQLLSLDQPSRIRVRNQGLVVTLTVTAVSYTAQVVTADETTDIFTKTGHGLVAGQKFSFAATTMPTGLTAGTSYYATTVTANTFKVAATLGGAAIDFSSAGVAVTLTTATPIGSIVTATKLAGGHGFTPSQSSGYTVAVSGGTGGVLALTTNAAGQVLTVALTTVGVGYTAGTIEIAPNHFCANLRDASDTDVPLYGLLRGRPVQAGDVVYIKHKDPNTTEIKTFRRTVLRVERDQKASHVGTNKATDGDLVADDQLFSEVDTRNPSDIDVPEFVPIAAPTGWSVARNSDTPATAWNGLVEGASYNGAYGERYTITVVKSGDATTARLRLRSASGGFSANDIGAAGEITAITVGNVHSFKVLHAALGGLAVNLVRPASDSLLVAGQIFVGVIKSNRDGGTTDADLTNGSNRNALNPDATIRRLKLVSGTSYSGPRDTRYVITVTKGVTNKVAADATPYDGAEIQVTDTTGIDRPQTYTITHGTEMDLGTYGLRFKFDTLAGTDDPADTNVGLRKGDTFFIDAVAAAATGPLGVLVLSGQVTDATLWDTADLEATVFDLEFRSLFSGEVPKQGNAAPDLAWVPTTAGVRVRYGLELEITSRDEGYTWVPVKESAFGRLFLHWRGLVPALAGEAIKFLKNETDIKARFGVEDMDNPACMAALIAFRGSQGKGVYAARLRTNDLAGYVTILKQAERTDGIYAVAPATLDLEVQQLVRDHVNKCSQEDWKLWRRAYLGAASPGAYALLAVNDENGILTGTITANSSGNVVVTAQGAGFVTQGIRAGDLYRTNYGYSSWGDPSWTEYEVLEVNSNDELLLTAGPSAAITPAVKFELWRPDTGLSQVEFVGNRAESFANRRVCVIWNDAPLAVTASGSLQRVPVYYLAAEIAGLRSALVQQQGLTYTELDFALDRSPSMFTKYTQEELNLAASKGVMIITQESEDGPIFIRHQLTTKTTEGSLYYEDSIGFNLDMIAYGCKDLLQPFIGKQNATPETVATIETNVRALLNSFKTARGLSTIGPALIEFSHEGKVGDVLVEIDPVFKDRINIGVNLELPLPINTIICSLNATTIQDHSVAA